MKINTKSIFCVLLTFLFLSPGVVKADEVVRYITNESSSSETIIRHYKDNLDVVCYRSFRPYFMMYSNGYPTSYALYVSFDTICDFHIYNDTVYICGRGGIDFTGTAQIAYFDVATLSSPGSANVSYLALPTMKMVSAIEVNNFASRKHVVGVGEDLKSEGMMVDIIDETSYWRVHFCELGGDTISMSDLAITNNYIVVTSRRKLMGGFCSGRIWFLNKPTMPGFSLFPGVVDYLDVNDIGFVGSKYLVRKLLGDEFVTAYKRGLYSMGGNPFVLSYYNADVYGWSTIINESSETTIYDLGDIARENTTRTVALLVYSTKGSTYESLVYEVPSYYPLVSSVNAHVYYGARFISIDKDPSFDIDFQHFVSSGYSSSGTPYYMRLNHFFFGTKCFEKKENVANHVNIDHKAYSDDLNNAMILQEPLVFQEEKRLINIETPCFIHSHTPADK